MPESHPSFTPPSDPNISIWRYVSLPKFIALLEGRSLFFPRADRLGDEFEGSYPVANEALRDSNHPMWRQASELHRACVRWTAISCWHASEDESAALWALYAEEGIAIRSTYARLVDAIVSGERIYFGMVRYIDYEREHFSEGNALNAFTYKRKSFEHEREVRAVLVRWPASADGQIDVRSESISDGVNVPVNLERLLVEVRVSPLMPPWYADVVSAVVRRWDSPVPVLRSSLSANAFF